MFLTYTPKNVTVIQFDQLMLAISSAIFGGGMREVDFVINYTLTERVEVEEMSTFCWHLAGSLGCDPERTIVLLTAVSQMHGAWSEDRKCFMTVGLGNAVSLFPEYIFNEQESLVCTPGTINSIHIVGEALTESALVEAYGVAKIAIADSLAKKSVGDANGHPCVATRTDCSVVFCPAYGEPPLQFAGSGTAIGQQIITSTQDAFDKAFKKKYPNGLPNPA